VGIGTAFDRARLNAVRPLADAMRDNRRQQHGIHLHVPDIPQQPVLAKGRERLLRRLKDGRGKQTGQVQLLRLSATSGTLPPCGEQPESRLGIVFDVLNGGVGRMRLFLKAAEFAAFERIIEKTLDSCRMSAGGQKQPRARNEDQTFRPNRGPSPTSSTLIHVGTVPRRT
jgi:hypothetical protein